MRYIVMECGLSYAVVLDSEGRFLKVPNLGYEVGQVLEQVVIQDSPRKQKINKQRVVSWAAAAACICIVAIGSLVFWQSPMGTVRMQINPDIEMSVNRFDRVVGLEGINKDGKALIEGYHSYGKTVETVSDELADRAVEMDYLSDGGNIALIVKSENAEWKNVIGKMLLLELDIHFDHRINVEIVSDSSERSAHPATITVTPDTSSSKQIYDSDDDYDDRDDDEEDDDYYRNERSKKQNDIDDENDAQDDDDDDERYSQGDSDDDADDDDDDDDDEEDDD